MITNEKIHNQEKFTIVSENSRSQNKVSVTSFLEKETMTQLLHIFPSRHFDHSELARS